MIDILAHRGFWLTKADQNSSEAIERAFEHGFGLETDVRDCDGELLISHDMPRKGQAISLGDLVALWCRYDCKPLIALNIKADGLASAIGSHFAGLPSVNWFAFDMSVPDSLAYARHGLPFLCRRSEYEGACSLEEQAAGLWMDCFQSPCVSAKSLASVPNAARLCIVSPELHGRPHETGWDELASFLKACPERALDSIALCTDHPQEASAFFNKNDTFCSSARLES